MSENKSVTVIFRGDEVAVKLEEGKCNVLHALDQAAKQARWSLVPKAFVVALDNGEKVRSVSLEETLEGGETLTVFLIRGEASVTVHFQEHQQTILWSVNLRYQEAVREAFLFNPQWGEPPEDFTVRVTWQGHVQPERDLDTLCGPNDVITILTPLTEAATVTVVWQGQEWDVLWESGMTAGQAATQAFEAAGWGKIPEGARYRVPWFGDELMIPADARIMPEPLTVLPARGKEVARCSSG